MPAAARQTHLRGQTDVANVASASRAKCRESGSGGGRVGAVGQGRRVALVALVRSPTCALLRSATMRGHSETMPVAHVKPDRHVPAALGAALGAALHRGALPPRPHPATRSSTSWCPIHKQIDKQSCVLTNKIAKPNLTNLLKRHVELRAKPHAALKAHVAWKPHAASSKPLNPCEQNLSILTASVCFAARCGWRHTRSARIACASMREP